MEIHSETFRFNYTISIEDITYEHHNKYHNDIRNQTKVKIDFYSHFSDYSAHNAANTFEHMKVFIQWMYERTFS